MKSGSDIDVAARVWLLMAACLPILFACTPTKAPPIERDYPLTKITNHVYVLEGPNQSPNRENQGFSNNPGFVLVRGGVVVIDPGASVQVGEMVLKKIAGVTRDPVIAVFDTHLHGDHWLGNQAIKAAYPKAIIYAHPKMTEAIKAGAGENWVKMMDQATQGASRGTAAVAPDLGLDNDDALRLHGMTFHIIHKEQAHTDNDIMIEVAQEGVIFLGDIVMNKRIAVDFPEQANISGQIAAIDAALKSKAIHFIPGHGSCGGREIALAQRAFLVALHTAVKKYYAQGLSDSEISDRLKNDLAGYKDWVGFDRLARLVSAAYRQVETESF